MTHSGNEGRGVEPEVEGVALASAACVAALTVAFVMLGHPALLIGAIALALLIRWRLPKLTAILDDIALLEAEKAKLARWRAALQPQGGE